MKIKPIRNDMEHKAALAEVDRLERLEPVDGTPDADALEVLYTLVEAYEEERHPIEPPDPIDAVLFRADQMGWTRKDLEPYIGSRNRVAEVLNRKRPVSLAMIRNLARAGVPADALIREPRKGTRRTVPTGVARRSGRKGPASSRKT